MITAAAMARAAPIVNAAGEHRVTLRYWPRDLSRDLTLAGIGLILLAASLLLTLRRERTT